MDASAGINERAVVIGDSMVGVVTEPAGGSGQRPAVVMLNSGLLHRVGMGRLHVALARRLARQGHLCLRLDFSGVGDSPRSSSGGSQLKRCVGELEDALDLLQSEWRVERSVILGNCSGAEVAIRAGALDPRIDGVIALNPEGQFKANQPKPLRFYLRARLFEPLYWRMVMKGHKSVGGAVQRQLQGTGSLSDYDSEIGTADWQALAASGTRVLIVLSQYEPRLDLFLKGVRPLIKSALADGTWRLHILEGADHLFNLLQCQDRLMGLISDWLSEQAREPAPAINSRPKPSAKDASANSC